MTLPPSIKYMTTVGIDGANHIIPMDEEHDLHFTCQCNPVQEVQLLGPPLFIHRVLTC